MCAWTITLSSNYTYLPYPEVRDFRSSKKSTRISLRGNLTISMMRVLSMFSWSSINPLRSCSSNKQTSFFLALLQGTQNKGGTHYQNLTEKSVSFWSWRKCWTVIALNIFQTVATSQYQVVKAVHRNNWWWKWFTETTGGESGSQKQLVVKVVHRNNWWWKWFPETTGQIITVTGQIHGRLYYYQSCTSKHPAPFST